MDGSYDSIEQYPFEGGSMFVKKLFFLLVTGFFLSILSFSNAFADAENGAKLFKNKKLGNCKTCHNITAKKKVGPGLKGVVEKYDGNREFLVKWIMDPKGMWKSDDPLIADMKKRLKREGKTLRMKPKGKLTEEQANDLIDYLETLK